MVACISEAKGPKKSRKKEKKSYWFEYAEKKGVDPHKSVWRNFVGDQKAKQNMTSRRCTKCGTLIHTEGKFCERCGQSVKSR